MGDKLGEMVLGNGNGESWKLDSESVTKFEILEWEQQMSHNEIQNVSMFVRRSSCGGLLRKLRTLGSNDVISLQPRY